MVEVCREVLPPEYLEDLAEIEDFDEAFGFVFTTLLELCVDPEEFLRQKGILE